MNFSGRLVTWGAVVLGLVCPRCKRAYDVHHRYFSESARANLRWVASDNVTMMLHTGGTDSAYIMSGIRDLAGVQT
jgi:hypothetical protein